MKRNLNPELDRIILDALSEKYKLSQPREGIHLSTLVYCLTRSFLDKQIATEPTDNEIMLFTTGYGLQDIMTPKEAIVPVIEKDGIVYRPDFVFPYKHKDGGDWLCEIKTTRSGVKRYVEGNYPETWIEYIMGGCYMMGVDTYYLSVLYVSERPTPKLVSETLVFEPVELLTNWNRLVERKKVYEEAVFSETPPLPFKWCKKWECDYCKHHTQCDVIIMLENRKQAERDIKELW